MSRVGGRRALVLDVTDLAAVRAAVDAADRSMCW